jgi:hypothetical protein
MKTPFYRKQRHFSLIRRDETYPARPATYPHVPSKHFENVEKDATVTLRDNDQRSDDDAANPSNWPLALTTPSTAGDAFISRRAQNAKRESTPAKSPSSGVSMAQKGNSPQTFPPNRETARPKSFRHSQIRLASQMVRPSPSHLEVGDARSH